MTDKSHTPRRERFLAVPEHVRDLGGDPAATG
jgi:hypothetical protein